MMFPERIKSLRMKKRYSQAELSKIIGVKNNTIWRWENNKAKPDSEMILKIAKALNTTASYLLGETDNQTLDVHNLAQNLAQEDIDLKEPITAGISDDKITVHDGNSNFTFSFPNNEEGRKSLAFLLKCSQGQTSSIFANSISGDNNSGNNLGIIQDKE